MDRDRNMDIDLANMSRDEFSYNVYMNPSCSRGFGVRVGSAHGPRPLSKQQIIRHRLMLHRDEKEKIQNNIRLTKAGLINEKPIKDDPIANL